MGGCADREAKIKKFEEFEEETKKETETTQNNEVFENEYLEFCGNTTMKDHRDSVPVYKAKIKTKQRFKRKESSRYTGTKWSTGLIKISAVKGFPANANENSKATEKIVMDVAKVTEKEKLTDREKIKNTEKFTEIENVTECKELKKKKNITVEKVSVIEKEIVKEKVAKRESKKVLDKENLTESEERFSKIVEKPEAFTEAKDCEPESIILFSFSNTSKVLSEAVNPPPQFSEVLIADPLPEQNYPTTNIISSQALAEKIAPQIKSPKALKSEAISETTRKSIQRESTIRPESPHLRSNLPHYRTSKFKKILKEDDFLVPSIPKLDLSPEIESIPSIKLNLSLSPTENICTIFSNRRLSTIDSLDRGQSPDFNIEGKLSPVYQESYEILRRGSLTPIEEFFKNDRKSEINYSKVIREDTYPIENLNTSRSNESFKSPRQSIGIPDVRKSINALETAKRFHCLRKPLNPK